MQGHIQKVQYEGYLADDAELRYFASGNPVLNFRIGSTRKYNDREGKEVKETTWMNCSITKGKWAEALAAMNPKLSKGSHVIVFGRLRVNEFGGPRVYQRKDGNWTGVIDLSVDDMKIYRLGGRTNGGQSNNLANEGDLPY